MKTTLRFLSLLLCLCLCLPLFACGSDGPEAPTDTTAGTVTDPVTDAPTEAPTEAPTDPATEPETEPETLPPPAFTFTAFEPEEGSTHVLIPDDLYAWYAPYTSEDAYYSSMQFPDKLKNAFSVPVNLTWAGEGNATGYTVRYGLTPDLSGSDTLTVETKKAKADLDRLFVGSVYYWQVTAHTEAGDVVDVIHSFRTEETVRLMHIEGLDNARDIGGHMTSFGVKMKQGICYRSAEMNLLGRRAQETLKNEYGITTDLDLRNFEEATSGESDVPGLKYIHVNGLYYKMAISSPENLCEELRPFADPENFPMIFHCGVGRDRTGTVALLIEALCGMSEVDIVRDYEETYLRTSTNKKVPNETCETNLTGFVLPMIDYLKTTYGNVSLVEGTERCLLSIGMTPEEITAIRRNLLDDAWVPTEVNTEWEMPVYERATDSDEPVVSFDADALYGAYRSINQADKIRSADLGDGYVTFTIDRDGEMPVLIVDRPTRLASAVLIRYRIHAQNPKIYMEIFIDSVNNTAVAGSNAAFDIVYDGEWHTIVVDLESMIPAYNGYYCEYCRMDFLNRATAGDSIDVSYVGFFTSAEAAERYAENVN